jgi:hypothetical protein
VLLRCVDFGFGRGITPNFRTVKVNVVITIITLMLMPETEDITQFMGNSRVPILRRVLVLEVDTEMRTMATRRITPFRWDVTRDRRSLDIEARGLLDNGNIMRISIIPDPRIGILFALVVAVGPLIVLDLVLMELK